MRTRLITMPLALVALSTLLACGHGGDLPVAPVPMPRPSEAVGQPVAPPVAQDPRGEALLLGLRDAFARCTGVEVLVKSYSEGHYKSGKRVNELRKSTYRTKVLWAKPSKFAGDILETDNFLVGGAKMASTDGKKVRVRAKGVLGLFPLTLEMDNALLSSNRNHGFSQMSPDALMSRLMSAEAVWTVVGEDTGGVRVEITNVRRPDAGITSEFLTIDPRTLALKEVVMLEGQKKVAEFKFERFRWNPTVPKGAFEI